MSDTANRRSILALCMLLSVMISQPLSAGAQQVQGATLEKVVVLSRHGVRSATNTGKVNDTDSWPVWAIPPDFLTLNGRNLMAVLAQGYWQRYATLLGGSCDGVYVWADNGERTIFTARSLVNGFLAFSVKCGNVPVYWLLSAKADPLFHPLSGEATDFPTPGSLYPNVPSTVPGQAADAIVTKWALQSPATASQISSLLTNLGDSNSASEFKILEAALGCSQGCVSNAPISIQAETDGSAKTSGALATASNASEAFMLEYSDGWQPGQIAWGRLGNDPSTIQANLKLLLTLHVDAYKLVQRNSVGASMQASNLANEIVQIFNQTANSNGTPCPQVAEGQEVCPPSSAKLIFLVGHDTNIGTLGGMLGMDWDLSPAGLPADDMPPGGALIFELWNAASRPEPWVQISFITVNLPNFPPAPLSCLQAGGPNCLSVVPITGPQGCDGPVVGSCTLTQFQNLIQKAGNPYFTFTKWTASPPSTSAPRKAPRPATARKPSGR